MTFIREKCPLSLSLSFQKDASCMDLLRLVADNITAFSGTLKNAFQTQED